MTQAGQPHERWRGAAWPTHPDMLVDTARCPACFVEIVASPCPSCGLDLGDPRTFEVLDLSQRIAELVDVRADTLQRIASAVAPPSTAAASAMPSTAMPSPAMPSAPEPTKPEPTAPEPTAPEPSAPSSTAPRPTAPEWAAPEPNEVHGVSTDAAAVMTPPATAGAAAEPAATPTSWPAPAPVPAGSGFAPPVTPTRPPGPPRPPVPDAPTAGAPTSAVPTAGTPQRGPRRSGVQVFLLSIGVVLLAVAAAFFLTVAWVSGGIGLRSAIIALATAGVIVTASLLRRRRLTATAEGIALLGIALVALDVWAVRANDLAGAAGVDLRLYWGIAAVAAGAGFLGWARVSGLRAPLSSGLVAMALGVGVTAAGLVSADGAPRWYAFGLAVSAVTVVAPRVPRLASPGRARLTIETTVLHAMAAVAAMVATTAALVMTPDRPWAPLIATLPVAGVAALHAIVLSRRGDRWLAPAAGVAAVLVLGAGVATTALRLADATFAAAVPLLIATLVALALEAAARRPTGAAGRLTLNSAALTAGAGAAVAALVAALTALSAFVEPLRGLLRPFSFTAFSSSTPDAASTGAVLALGAAGGMALLAWRITGRLAERATVLSIAAAVVLLLAGGQMRLVIAVVLWNLLLALGAVMLRRGDRLAPAVTLTTAGVAAVLAWTLSFLSPFAWAVATVGIAVLLVLVAPVARGVRMGAAIALAIFLPGSALILPGALDAGAGVSIAGMNPVTAATAVAVLCALLPVLTGGGPFAGSERRVAATTALTAAAVGVTFVPTDLDTAQAVWVLGSTLVGLGTSAAVLFARRSWTAPRQTAALLLALFVSGAAVSVVRLLAAPALALSLVLALVVVAVAAFSLLLLRGEPLLRGLAEAGAIPVAVVAVIAAPSTQAGIAVMVLAVAAVLAAVDGDGVFVGRAWRRHLVWLALALGSVALWLQLSGRSVDTVEAYTLPVAGGLALIAVLAERARRRVAGRSAGVPAAVLSAAAALAVLPTAVADVDDVARSVAAGVAGGVLLLAGAWLRPPRTPDVLPVAVAGAGAVGLVAVLAVRLIDAASHPRVDGAYVDLALSLGAAVLVAAAVGVARREPAWAAGAARASALIGVGLFVAGIAVLLGIHGGPLARAVVPILALGTVAAVVRRWGRDPIDTPVGWTALAGAGLVATVGVAVGLEPVEWLTVPLALAAVATALADPDGERPRPVVLWTVGIAVGLLPSTVLLSDAPVRAVLVMAVAAALLVSAAAIPLAAQVRPLALPTLAVAALALIIAGVSRAVIDLDAAAFDAWTLGAALPVLAAGLVTLRRRPTGAALVAPLAAGAAMAIVVVLTGLRLVAAHSHPVRALFVIAGVLAVGLLWRGPRHRAVWWTAVAGAVVVAAVASVTGTADPVEIATAPIAAALLIDGIRSLRRRPDARSWPTLGVGLTLLLVPSLLFDFGADNALWRVIALGTVALVVLLAGARWRLQAPVLLGGVVLLVHAVAQLWPWITAVYESVSGLWWLWLGIAGVLLIVVAATYERRIRELRAVALAIRALR